MSVSILDKKHKKDAIRKRNLKHRLLFLHVERIQAAAVGLAAPEFDPSAHERERERLKKKQEEENPVWSAKTQAIRNRLTDRKRQAQDRWNRFAGTEGGGARGL